MEKYLMVLYNIKVSMNTDVSEIMDISKKECLTNAVSYSDQDQTKVDSLLMPNNVCTI